MVKAVTRQTAEASHTNAHVDVSHSLQLHSSRRLYKLQQPRAA
jgi:hypothetical protein